jgi:3-dehydroquinate synthase
MAVSPASDSLVVQSHRGPYSVDFADDAFEGLNAAVPAGAHVVIDRRVAGLYAADLAAVLQSPSVLRIDADETSKSLEQFPGYVDHLVAHGIRRSHTLVAIGGGVIQDIVCFLSATLLRGVPWVFYPTTLLSQADSCIGSKSSINAGGAKNILGTFTPPARVRVATRVLRTLSGRDRRSGVGEMLKVHAIAGPAAFDEIARDYAALFADERLMARYVRRSLEIKRTIVELDEFDRGPRNVMNYGHSFGHAIESATDYGVPHGIAVTIGMDMANYAASRLGRAPATCFERMHPTLQANFVEFDRTPVPLDRFLAALAKDKKNTDAELGLVLPDREGRIVAQRVVCDETFRETCDTYLRSVRMS